jgi:hypothetical protein
MVQPMSSKDKQPIIASVPTIVHVTTNLPTYVATRSNHQPLDGGQPGNSLGGSSSKRDPLGKPPSNILVAYFGWLTFDSHMFIPWYRPLVVQHVS